MTAEEEKVAEEMAVVSSDLSSCTRVFIDSAFGRKASIHAAFRPITVAMNVCPHV